MRRASLIGLLLAASAVIGCNTPTAPDATGDEIVPPVRAVAVQYRPVYVTNAGLTVK